MDKRGASPPERVENDETPPGDADRARQHWSFCVAAKSTVHPSGSTTPLLLEGRGSCDILGCSFIHYEA